MVEKKKWTVGVQGTLHKWGVGDTPTNNKKMKKIEICFVFRFLYSNFAPPFYKRDNDEQDS